MNAVPISAGAAAANGQYPIVIFYRAELDVVFVVFHNKGSICSEVRSQKSDIRGQRAQWRSQNIGNTFGSEHR